MRYWLMLAVLVAAGIYWLIGVTVGYVACILVAATVVYTQWLARRPSK